MKTEQHASPATFRSVRSLAPFAALVLTLASASGARASGITSNGVTSFMFRQVFKMKAGVDYTLSTRNLSGSSDTIIHVLRYPDGQFMAGNDDTIGVDPDSGQQTVHKFSTAYVPAASTDRTVFLVVRGKPGTPDGTADFRILGKDGLSTVKDTTTPNIDFSAGFVQNLGSLAAGTHVTTVEQTFGTIDTMVMVVGSDPATTLAFDDDDGIDRMSFLRLGSACSSNCQIIVGTPKPVITIFGFGLSLPTGPMTLIWDETIETAGHDTDKDGLSTELEALLSTNPSRFDTDGDGIGDGFEVYGAVKAGTARNGATGGGGKDGNLLKFPKYGASPLGQDVFVEIDWVPACPASDPLCCTGTVCAPGTTNADQRQATAAVLTQAFDSMNGAVRAHFDAGVPTAAGDVSARFGQWGGASRLADNRVDFARTSPGNYKVTVPEELIGDKDCFRGVVPARVGFFHHLIISDDATRGRLPVLGTTLFESAACALVKTNDGSIAHELGHNFNLRHGGFADKPDGTLNCKMNYGSIMSYPGQLNVSPFAPGYSGGQFEGLILNGSKMDEVAGLGVTDPGILNVFNNGSMGRGFLDAASFPRGIDWNMDGRIQAGLVRAPANWAGNTCAAPYLRANWYLMLFSGLSNSLVLSSAALPVMTVAEASAASPQIYGTGLPAPLQGGPRKPALLIGAGNASPCQQSGLGSCTIWPQRSAVNFSNSLFNPQSQLAVAGPLVAFRDAFGLWETHRGPSVTGWVGPRFLASGITGDPAVIESNGRVKVYAVDSGGFLRRWEFDEATGTWPVMGETDRWEDGTLVQSAFGIGIAHGVIRPSGSGIFAAIPNRAKTPPPAGSPMPIEFARHTSTTFTQTVTVPPGRVPKFGSEVPGYTYTTTVKQDKWQRFPAPGPSTAVSRPGLVYAPFDLAVPDDGRFYLTWVRGGAGFQSNTALIRFTEGNDQTAGVTSRRLNWMPNQQTPFADPDSQSRDLRLGVGLGRFGLSVAGVATDPIGSSYFPAADGIVNADVHDYPDNLLVRHNLPCSVHGESCDDSP